MVTPIQLRVVMGVVPAAIITAVVWVIALRQPLGTVEAEQQVALTLPWLLVPAACLFVGIGFIANRRFLSEDAIDGGASPSHTDVIASRYVQNTLEQAVLAALVWLALAAIEPARAAVLVPMLATLFGIGRIAFWIGYLLAPWGRAFGFGLTFYPTAVALVWLIVRIVA
ncbi:MAG: conserved rane protein of unknown function [Sphingomonas bacterium]|uniref:MAPEG family protein n=1 Tax=Sphingomonas bacterium TaxID=1895847 RepID=UPI002637335F|nr:MAPEG family protein [Sphingomonas bacterium]MDB5710962.1 conserved rane protein of unknown function [Sphingomonas bacterium]